MGKIINFFKEVRVEMTKVIWPSREQTVRMTLYVIGFALFLALVLGAADYGLSWLIDKFIVR